MTENVERLPRSDTTVQQPASPVRARPLAIRNFRLLLMGEGVSLLGDQFYIVALPWLVFQLTGSMLALGTILMLEGIPRAVLMLVGGVMTDRFSPRAIMITSNLARLAITVVLTLIVLFHTTQLWMLYVIAFSFGLVDAFFHPAFMAMVPMIVDEDNLQASNSLMQGAFQITQIAGPGIAGIMVQAVGVVFSFAFDALTFLFTSITLLLMIPPAVPKSQAEGVAEHKSGGMLGEIGDMFRSVRRDSALTALILVSTALNFLFTGPLVVGSAALSKLRFAEGSAAYGALLSAFGIGSLVGMLAGMVIQPKRIVLIGLSLIAGAGVCMSLLGFAPVLIVACVLMALMGFSVGFTNVILITWIQKRIAKDMMGRVMSLLGLASVGLMPLSNAVAGALADVNLTVLFVAAGLLMILTSALAASSRDLRGIES